MTTLASASPPSADLAAAAVIPIPPDIASSRSAAIPARRRRIGRMVLIGLVAAGCLGGGIAWTRARPSRRSGLVVGLPMQLVGRADLSTIITASGRVESSSQTTIACELERLEIRTGEQIVNSNGSAQIIEIIEEGSKVRKGDILCRLDASDYEELVRLQLIKTEQSRAAWQQSKLNFEVAELAVREYRDGLFKQNIESMEGKIALAEADLERSGDRLRWTEKMLDKQYAALSQRATALRNLSQARLDLQSSRFELLNFREYGSPKNMKVLMSEVEKRRAEEIANNRRVTRLQERLEHYQKMVGFCTIRAPHDGFLIYATDPYRRNATRLQEGVEVRQQQPLFYLPDLTKIEIITYLHESVARRVKEGMLARAKIEGLPGRTLEGRVVSIGPLPVESPDWTIDDDVKFFVATVKLDRVPEGILPAMSAEVEIDIERMNDVLAVPTEAVAVEQGRDVCYVAGVDGLHRRAVSIGKSSRNYLEVTKGLHEGESVLINPSRVEAIESLVVPDSEMAESELVQDAQRGSAGVANPTVD